MSDALTISLKETIPIFNLAIQNEFDVRFMGEEDRKLEILQDLFSLAKTIRLSTLFTRSGLEMIVVELTTKKQLLDFIMDLHDVFIFNCTTLIGAGVEKKIISVMAESFSYTSNDKSISLFGPKFSDMFATEDIIQETLKNNRWLITVVMFRFMIGDHMDEYLKKQKQANKVKT